MASTTPPPEDITVIQDFDVGPGQKRVVAHTKNPPAVGIANDETNAKLFLNHLNGKLSASTLPPLGTMTNYSDKGANYKVFVAGTNNPTESDKQYLIDVFKKVNKPSSSSAVVRYASSAATIPVDRDAEIVRLKAENVRLMERVQALEKQMASSTSTTTVTPPPVRPVNPLMAGIFAELKKKTAETEPSTTSLPPTTRPVNSMFAAMQAELKQKAGTGLAPPNTQNASATSSSRPPKAPTGIAEEFALQVKQKPQNQRKTSAEMDAEREARKKEEANKRKQQETAQSPILASLAQRRAAIEGQFDEPKTTTVTLTNTGAVPYDDFNKPLPKFPLPVKKADDDDW